jgi:hypothetical protein
MLGAAFTLPDDLTSNTELWKDDEMSNGQEHDERRKAQAAAAAKPENKARTRKFPGKGNRNRWKKEM